MITFRCDCGKILRAREDLAGRRTRCSGCNEVLRIPQVVLLQADDEPAADLDGDAAYRLMIAEATSTPSVSAAAEAPAPTPLPAEDSTFHPIRVGKYDPAAAAAKAESQFRRAGAKTGQPSLLEYSYLLLAFALIPLAGSLLAKEEKADIHQRFIETVRDAPPEDQKRIEIAMAGESASLEDQIEALPGGKLAGAHLSRTTSTHWIYAAIAGAAYLLLLSACFSVERAQAWHLVAIAAFTSTVGVLFLLLVQFCAMFRFGSIRAGGIGLVIMLVLAFIGWSYNSANDPESGFLLSAFGFTFGVGLCEEFAKAIPLFIVFQRHSDMGWRTACLWGLASGIGFGLAEGIIYSSNHYNGIAGGDIYLVRFISCVALHAMWSASVGIAIARNVDTYETVDDAWGFAMFAIQMMLVPMTLHGLYDTMLKKEMNALALLVALLSFAWLAWHIELARGASPGAGRLREEKRWAY